MNEDSSDEALRECRGNIGVDVKDESGGITGVCRAKGKATVKCTVPPECRNGFSIKKVDANDTRGSIDCPGAGGTSVAPCAEYEHMRVAFEAAREQQSRDDRPWRIELNGREYLGEFESVQECEFRFVPWKSVDDPTPGTPLTMQYKNVGQYVDCGGSGKSNRHCRRAD